MASRVAVWLGLARQARFGGAWPAWLGRGGRGRAGMGLFWLGLAGAACSGGAGAARLGVAGLGRRGKAGSVLA